MFCRRQQTNKKKEISTVRLQRFEEPEDFFFQAINRKGESIRCEALFTFSANGKDYLVYTDNTHTLLGRTNIYATLFHPDTLVSGRPLFLRDPATEAEWRLIEQTAARVLQQM